MSKYIIIIISLLTFFLHISFISAGQEFIQLLKPFGGECFVSEDSVSIEWESKIEGTADIEFSQDGGENWEKIFSAIDLSTGKQIWKIPKVNALKCKIRIITKEEIADESSCFAIGYKYELAEVLLDETYFEWQNRPEIASVENARLLKSLKAANNTNFLFLKINFNKTFKIQGEESVNLIIDADNDLNTGKQINGLGAEIIFDFSRRKGWYYNTDSYGTEISFADIFMVVSPTVWSDKYEIAISRQAIINNKPLFARQYIRLLLKDGQNGEFLPAGEGGVGYYFSDRKTDTFENYSIKKKNKAHLRFMSHNVEFDAFFETTKKEYFSCMYKSISPDIIGFQEIYKHTPIDLINLVEDILPSANRQNWKASNIKDTWIVSRFDIVSTYRPGGFGNGAFLLDLRPEFDTHLLVVSAHPPCCDNDANRQKETDAIAAFIRDAKASGGEIDLPENTPVVVLGDMNFVGDPFNLKTITHGDIFYENSFGDDFIPDWDDTPFEDAKPFVTGLPMTFTQGNGTYPGSYCKGRLDFVFYSGSVMELTNSYVFYTASLPKDTIRTYSLKSDASERASDHFPVVADFMLETPPAKNYGYEILPLRENNSNGIPIHNGEIRTISGVVAADNNFGSNGPAFVQDKKAGIAIYGSGFINEISAGDSVTLTGRVDHFNGLTEIKYENGISKLIVHKNDALIIPETISIHDILSQDYDSWELIEGRLVRLNNVVFEATGKFEADTNYELTDGIRKLTIRIDGDTDIAGHSIPIGKVLIIGCIGQFDTSEPFNSGYQILPRSITDINDSEKEIIIIQPPDADTIFSGTIYPIRWNYSGVQTINLYYQLNDDEQWIAIATNLDATEDEYLWSVPKGDNHTFKIKIEDATDNSIAYVTDSYEIEQNITGIESGFEKDNFANVFPNPFTDYINIEMNSTNNQWISIKLLDISGREIKTIEISNPLETKTLKIYTAKVECGLYICNIKTSEKRISKLLVKK